MKSLSFSALLYVLLYTATMFIGGCSEEPIIEEYVPPTRVVTPVVRPIELPQEPVEPAMKSKEEQLESRWATGERDEQSQDEY